LKQPDNCKMWCNYLECKVEQECIIYNRMIYIPQAFMTKKQFDDGFDYILKIMPDTQEMLNQFLDNFCTYLE